MKKFTFTFLPRLLGLVFLWMNLGHAPDLHAQTVETSAGLSALSDEVTATPVGLPSQITDLRVVAVGDGKVTLAWTAPNLNGGTFRNYDIFWDDGDTNETILDYSTTSKTLTLSNDIPYTFTIWTQTSSGNSVQSNPVTATPLAPDVYTFTAIQSDNGEVIEFQLAVTKSNEEGSESFSLRSGYTSTIFLIQDAEVKYTEDYQVSDISASCKRFDIGCPLGPYFTIDKDDSNIDHLQDLTIKIEIDKVNNSATDVVYTAQRDSEFLLDNIFPELKPAPPSQITDFTATAGVGEITLTWTAPDLNNNGDVVTYTITYNDNNGVEQIETVDAPTTEKLITNLANGHSYIFSITATNNIPLTSAPATVTITTLTGTPSQPTNLQAIRNGGVVNITWEVPTDDGGSDITGYRLPHPTGGAVEVNKTSFKYLFTLSADNTYDIVVIARNVNGLGAPATVTVNALVELPSQITDFRATPLDGGVDLFWTSARLNGGTFENYTITYGDQTKSLFTHSTSSTRIPDLNNGEEYTFTITATTDLGTSTPSTATATPVGLPSQITDLSATAYDGGFTLTWTAPDLNGGTFEKYEIFFLNGDSELIRDHSTTSKIIKNPNNLEFNFTISTTTDLGTSALSDEVTSMYSAPQLPSPITDLRAVAGVGTITLTWTVPDLNGGIFSSYSITYDGASESVPEYSTTSKTISGLPDGTYVFKIRAVTSEGRGLVSNLVTVTLSAPQPPSQITDLSATAGDGEVELTWTAPNLNGGTFENYTITYGGETAKITSHSTTSTTISDLNNDEEYTFTISATTDLGTSTPSDGITATPLAPVVQLITASQITDLAATAGVGEITLTWTAPNLNGGTFEHYTITYGGETKKITSHSTTSTTIPDLNNGEEYTFTITATTSLGTSTPSDGITATPAGLASQITTLTAEAGNETVTLSWTPPDNGGSDILDYELEVTEVVGGTARPLITVALSSLIPLDDGVTSYPVPSLTNDTEYSFSLVARNAHGKTPKHEQGTTATPGAPVTVPAAITNLTAVAGDGQVTLSWTPPDDGGSPLTEYVLTATSSDGSTVPPIPQPAVTTTTAMISHPVPGLTNGVLYTFALVARSLAGDSPSAEVPATPAGLPDAINDLTAVAGDGTVTLSWTPPADGGSPLTEYVLTATSSDGSTVPPIPQPVVTTTTAMISHPVPGLTNGVLYTFALVARSLAGDSPAVSATATPAAAPGAVTNLTAVAGDGTVTLSWTPPDDGGSPLTEYVLTATSSDGSTVPPIPQPVVTTTTAMISHPVPGLTNGVLYTFSLSANNAVDDGPVVSATATPVPVPEPVTGLTATPGNGQLTLNWTAPVNNNGAPPIILYGIIVTPDDGESSVQTLVTGTSTSYTVPNLTNGVGHTVVVFARNASGDSPVAFIAPETSTTPRADIAATAPSVVSSLTAVPNDDGTVTLEWLTPANGGSSLTDYVLLITLPDGSAFPLLTQPSGTDITYTVSGLTNGTTYTFSLAATNAVGHGPAVSATATPAAAPGAVTNLTAVAGDGQIMLTWSAPELNGSTLTGYKVDYPGFPALTVDASATSTTITGLTNGVLYTFALVARSLAGDSPSVSASATPVATATAPQAVTTLTAVAGDGTVTLSWTPPDDGGSPLTEYVLTATSSDGSTVPPIPQPVVTTTTAMISHPVPGLTNGVLYTFSLSANNAVGDGPVVSATATPVPKPEAVTGLTSTPGNGQLTLNWTAPVNNNGAPPIILYGIIVTPDDGESSVQTLVTGTSTSYTVPNLTNGVGHTVVVFARNASGDSPVAFIAPETSTTPRADIAATAPAEVSNLTAAVSDGTVTLKWLTPANGGSSLTDYVLLITLPDGSAFPLLTQPSGTDITYTVSGLTNGTTYTFSLAATNAVGHGPAVSATATPAAAPGAVTNLTAVAGDGQIMLTWSAPELNGSTLTGYKVDYPGFPALTVDASATSTTITGLTNGVAYTFNVTPQSTNGDGVQVEVTATPVIKKLQTITFILSSAGVVGDTLDLSATASSMLEVTYVSSDPSIAEVGTGMNAGKLILKVKALDSVTITAIQAGNHQYATAPEVSQSITVSESVVLSVDVENTEIRVWPNPVATQLNISSGSRGKLSITLRNLTGQRLQEGELEGKGQIDVSLVPSGVYLLHIRTAEETTSYLIYKE